MAAISLAVIRFFVSEYHSSVRCSICFVVKSHFQVSSCAVDCLAFAFADTEADAIRLAPPYNFFRYSSKSSRGSISSPSICIPHNSLAESAQALKYPTWPSKGLESSYTRRKSHAPLCIYRWVYCGGTISFHIFFTKRSAQLFIHNA